MQVTLEGRACAQLQKALDSPNRACNVQRLRQHLPRQQQKRWGSKEPAEQWRHPYLLQGP